MYGLIDSPIKLSVSPKIKIVSGGQTLRTATSLGGSGATVRFSVPDPIRLVYTDPDGNIITPIGSPDFIKNVELALAHIRESSYGLSLIDSLNKPDIKISIYENNNGITNIGTFKEMSNRYGINWDPRSGMLVSSSKKVMSPTVMLAHELVHAILIKNNMPDFLTMTMGKLEGEKMIENIATKQETEIANELKEYGGRLFYDDWDSMVRMSGPLSTESLGIMFNRLPDE
jgi:hypothetical protein